MPGPNERSFLQKAFMDPPARPKDDRPWESLTQEEKDAFDAQAAKDHLYGRNDPSYLAQGMKSIMEALGPKPPPLVQAPEAQSWNSFMDQQDEKRKASLFERVQEFPVEPPPAAKSPGEIEADKLLNVKNAKTIEEKWQAIKDAQAQTGSEE